ncbi:Uncharacterised protein [Mycobacteroides abscessus subsp. abscessus]|nr:Uncharacterised protein [Mycobacteroides abscessus subsp. abscessus]
MMCILAEKEDINRTIVVEPCAKCQNPLGKFLDLSGTVQA